MTQVFYIPPSDEVIEQCAYMICNHLSRTVDPAYNSHEVRYGFAEFLKVMARIRANALNRAALSNEETNAAA